MSGLGLCVGLGRDNSFIHGQQRRSRSSAERLGFAQARIFITRSNTTTTRHLKETTMSPAQTGAASRRTTRTASNVLPAK